MSFLPQRQPRRTILANPVARPVTPPVRPARPATHMIQDPMHPGLAIAAFDHPGDWQAQSFAVWNFADHNNLALVFSRAASPDGALAFETLPHESFYHAPFGLAALFGAAGRYTTTVGGKSYGSTPRAPMSAIDALSQVVIPKHRGDRQGLRIVHAAPVPGLAQMLNQTTLAGIRHEGAFVRIAYQENGVAFEEEFYACCYWQSPNGGQTNWGLNPIVAIRAPASRLEGERNTLWSIARTLRANPQWIQVYMQIAHSLHNKQASALYQARHDALAQERQLGRQISEYNSWSRNLQGQVAADRARSEDRRNQQFGDLMMGRTAYQDPQSTTGNPHYDTGNHNHVWTDRQGNWQYSNDPLYDPNIGSGVAWEQARPQ